jgi:hypothetical protein
MRCRFLVKKIGYAALDHWESHLANSDNWVYDLRVFQASLHSKGTVAPGRNTIRAKESNE